MELIENTTKAKINVNSIISKKRIDESIMLTKLHQSIQNIKKKQNDYGYVSTSRSFPHS
jgi:hypothetical protein